MGNIVSGPVDLSNASSYEYAHLFSTTLFDIGNLWSAFLAGRASIPGRKSVVYGSNIKPIASGSVQVPSHHVESSNATAGLRPRMYGIFTRSVILIRTTD